MASLSKMELLEARVADLESELARMKGVARGREKISQMSDEVVDSNPYRWGPSQVTCCTRERKCVCQRYLWVSSCKIFDCLTTGRWATSALPPPAD